MTARPVHRQRLSLPWVPIRPLQAKHRPRILAHLLALSAQDRYLRFGYCASDEHVHNYVATLDFSRDEVLGIFNRRLQLVALAHLALNPDPKLPFSAEFGVSVLAHQRGRGLGAKLFARAVTRARNLGVQLFFVHALSENAAMLKIARHAGAQVEREGSESEAYLSLPHANLDSQISGWLQDALAALDYQLKRRGSQLQRTLALLQEIRGGVQQARHHRA